MNITSNADEVAKALRHIQRQIPFASSKALNETAKVIVSAENRKIARVFDNPVPATQKAVALVRPATKQRQEATVIVKDSVGKGNSPVQWLNAEVMGGFRRKKRNEKALEAVIGHNGVAIPSYGYKRNMYGNVTADPYKKAIKSLKAKDGKFFRGVGKRKNVIYQKTTTARNKKYRPFLILVRHAHYHKRFHFFKIGEKQFHRNINRLFDREFAKAIDGSHWKEIGKGSLVERGKFADVAKRGNLGKGAAPFTFI